ncbi:MAG: hypothetical protein HY901_13900, partial [Deltaproteobacteria bacterium]|nr:hypothetical protein [Deltaproteobacteria bacterium]
MNRRSLSMLPVVVVALGMFGFGPGSCGPDPVDPPPTCNLPEGCDPQLACGALDEAACTARTDCRAIFAYPDCAPSSDCAGGRPIFTACTVVPVEPPACAVLDETDCLNRRDCQANYSYPRCATDRDYYPAPDERCIGGEPVFTSCSTPACEPVVCDIACAHGLAVNERGCQVCGCAPVPCAGDRDCASGEVCLFPADVCPPNALCAPPQGYCGVIEQGCGSDSECQPGQQCVFPTRGCGPDAFCAPPRGTCRPVDGCQTDADCGVGKRCEYLATDAPACEGADCKVAPPMGGQCVDRTPCTDGSQCAWGETCALDPNDPCVKNACYTLLPIQTWCVPTCERLDEASCLVRPDCEPMYQSYRCGSDDAERCAEAVEPSFMGCKPAGCSPVMCEMYCPQGFKKDANGCDTCACVDDFCASDADCLPGQVCVFPMYEADCAAGEMCMMTSTR